MAPGRYFRLLLVGYFEGLDSERGSAWRAADSLAIRRFVHVGLEDATPHHSTMSRTRRLIDVDTVSPEMYVLDSPRPRTGLGFRPS